MDRGYPVALLLFVVLFLFVPAGASGEKETQGNRSPLQISASEAPSHPPKKDTSVGKNPEQVSINRPAQITFRTDPVLYAAASEKGDWLAFVSEKQGLPELWLRPADQSKGGPPQQLARGEGKLWEPAISRDGTLIAFVGDSHDAKGDIFLINRNLNDLTPKRLTGRETADGAPAFSPDGKDPLFSPVQAR